MTILSYQTTWKLRIPSPGTGRRLLTATRRLSVDRSSVDDGILKSKKNACVSAFVCIIFFSTNFAAAQVCKGLPASSCAPEIRTRHETEFYKCLVYAQIVRIFYIGDFTWHDSSLGMPTITNNNNSRGSILHDWMPLGVRDKYYYGLSTSCHLRSPTTDTVLVLVGLVRGLLTKHR